jgi:hypothetical protein
LRRMNKAAPYPAALIALVVLAALAPSCAKRNAGAPTAAVVPAAPPPASTARATYPEAVRAEALLERAGVPFETRDDLVPARFPEGCLWLAVYATTDPQIILETYAFADAAGATSFARGRQAELDALDGARGKMATNDTLVLVARYSLIPANAGAQDIVSKFLVAFAGGN